MDAEMQIHQNARQPAAIGNRCPHGSAFGACGQCGGGGAGGGARRTSGLMSWNEAYALWKSIQVSQARQADYLKAVQNNQEHLQKQAQQTGFLQALSRAFGHPILQMGQLITSAMKGAWQGLQTSLGKVVQNAQQTVRQFTAHLSHLGAMFAQASARLATMLGEAKTLLEDIWQSQAEGFKALMMRLMYPLKLQRLQGMFRNLLGKLTPQKLVERLKLGLQSLLKQLRGSQE